MLPRKILEVETKIYAIWGILEANLKKFSTLKIHNECQFCTFNLHSQIHHFNFHRKKHAFFFPMENIFFRNFRFSFPWESLFLWQIPGSDAFFLSHSHPAHTHIHIPWLLEKIVFSHLHLSSILFNKPTHTHTNPLTVRKKCSSPFSIYPPFCSINTHTQTPWQSEKNALLPSPSILHSVQHSVIWKHPCTQTHTHTHMYACACAHTHTHTHTHKHTHTNIYIHAHTKWIIPEINVG